jgi:hypothetical protein
MEGLSMEDIKTADDQSCTSGRNAFVTGMYPVRTGMIPQPTELIKKRAHLLAA